MLLLALLEEGREKMPGRPLSAIVLTNVVVNFAAPTRPHRVDSVAIFQIDNTDYYSVSEIAFIELKYGGSYFVSERGCFCES